jgi:acylphosphatase
MNMDECANVRVEGRVQGVGFRAFVHHQATTAGLSGWVRNLSDGAVEIQLEGPRAAIETVLPRVRQGPPGSRVDLVKVDWSRVNRQTEGFKILR